jgi:MFS family permease
MTTVDESLVPSRIDALRRRTVLSLVSGVALGSTGHIAAATVAAIVAGDMAGSSALAGAPGAAVVLGAAVGSTVLSRVMVRRGRRIGLSAGYAIGVSGAFVATAAILVQSLPVLLLGTLLIGFGNSSNQLSRYAAADLYPVARRASAIGIVVWGATVGAVIGPNLVGLLADYGATLGLPPYAGAYLVPVVFVGAAAVLSFALLRPDPYTLADRSEADGDSAESHAGETSIERILRRPNVPVAIVALVTGQVVMVLIMTMTPLHMTAHGHGLSAVGLVISAHTFGMFALSPISGRLTDRFGSARVVIVGLAVIAFSAVLSAAAPPDGGTILFLSLFLLGYGWNMGYVAGSTMLTTGLGLAERTRVEGLTDSLIWSSAAAAAFGSGIVVAAAGFAALGLIGAAMVIIPVWLVFVRRRAVASPTPS